MNLKRVFVSVSLSIALCGGLSAKTLATVDGVEITQESVAELLSQMPGASYDALPKEAQENLLNQAIERVLLSKEAKKSGVEKDGEYKTILEKVKKDLALEIWMKREFEKVKVTDKEIKEFYESNKDSFSKEETRKAKHILLKDEESAKNLIKELKKEKKDLASKFEEKAKELSIDPSAKQNGGDLGFFEAKQMVPDFSNAAFGMKKGELSSTPVQTQFGFHIIYLDDIKPKETSKLDEVKEQIENNLKMNKFRSSIQERAKSLREKAKVEYK